MPQCTHDLSMPAFFELQTSGQSMRYADADGAFGAASTFGGRWRVTDPAGEPLFSLAPCGAPGSDDREVVPSRGTAAATIMRDRRQVNSWVVLDPHGAEVMRASLADPYEVTLADASGVPVGRIWATATAVSVDLGVPSTQLHCLAMALPLYFAVTGALRVERLDTPAPTLALWD